MKLTAFILAAGMGERLRPVTDCIPKPLVPILGKPVLEHILEKISSLTSDTIGINLHYKRALVEKWIRESAFKDSARIFPENPVLGTGGALKNASAFLRDTPFLVHNADVLSDIDIRGLVERHLDSGGLATLAVHDYPEFNSLRVDEKGLFEGVVKSSGEASRVLAFTGVAVYSPEFLQVLPPGFSSVVDGWLKAISRGYRISTFDVSGCYWTDIGTPLSYARAVIRQLRENGETVHVDSSTDWCGRAELGGYCAIEKGTALNGSVLLRNCIVLPGTQINENAPAEPEAECSVTISGCRGSERRGRPRKTVYQNCILGRGFGIDLDEKELLDSSEKEGILIGTGGSERKYYRMKRNGGTAVSMRCFADDPDFERHIDYTQFFTKRGIPVPELLSSDSGNKSALFEDLGDLSLYSWLKCPRETGRIESIYRKVLDVLILIHIATEKDVIEAVLPEFRIFDYEHLRWETRYFMAQFVEGMRHFGTERVQNLDDEFHRLAARVHSYPKTLIHRDFQSQNIMVTPGGKPRLIDYQGTRIGPPGYDVASILWDPYYRIDENVRKNLADYYISRMKAVSRTFREDKFRDSLLPCRLQRHMQALGAYGFLSCTKGKRYFTKYIPEGLRLLGEDASLAKDEFPVLYNLVKRL